MTDLESRGTQAAHLMGLVVDFLREGLRWPLQRLIGGFDLVLAIAYSPKSLDFLREVIGLHAAVDYRTPLEKMIAKMPVLKVIGHFAYKDFPSDGPMHPLQVVFKVLPLEEEAPVNFNESSNFLVKKGCRHATIHETVAFLERHHAYLKKIGTNWLLALGSSVTKGQGGMQKVMVVQRMGNEEITLLSSAFGEFEVIPRSSFLLGVEIK